MAELEAWEALDLDDSDLPSLLRRCKRRRSTTPPAAAETPLSQPQNHPQQLKYPLPSSSSRCFSIPGPAGLVQAAMLRKDHDHKNSSFANHKTDDDAVLSTQDYIRKAMDDDSAEFDDDFSRRPWLSALQLLGAEDGLIHTTPISSIKECVNGDKVSKVVAVVKSSTPNGLGGLLVSLKDPTGTIGASIHHKVLSQSEFGKEITVGAVLILQEVAIFAPVESAHYLNVTLRNLVKVFCQNKDSSHSTSKLYKSACPVQYAADPDSCQKARAVQKMSASQKGSQNDNIIQSLCTRSTQSNSTNVTAAKRGCINQCHHAGNDTQSEDMIRTGGNNQEFVDRAHRGEKGGNLEGSLLQDADNITISLAETTTGEKTRGMQPLMVKATLPQWTDEQLDELFGDEDDGCLF